MFRKDMVDPVSVACARPTRILKIEDNKNIAREPRFIN